MSILERKVRELATLEDPSATVAPFEREVALAELLEYLASCARCFDLKASASRFALAKNAAYMELKLEHPDGLFVRIEIGKERADAT